MCSAFCKTLHVLLIGQCNSYIGDNINYPTWIVAYSMIMHDPWFSMAFSDWPYFIPPQRMLRFFCENHNFFKQSAQSGIAPSQSSQTLRIIFANSAWTKSFHAKSATRFLSGEECKLAEMLEGHQRKGWSRRERSVAECRAAAGLERWPDPPTSMLCSAVG